MKTYLKSLAIKLSFGFNAAVLFAAFVFYSMQPQGAVGFGRTLGFGTDQLAPLVTAANTPLPDRISKVALRLPPEKPPIPVRQ